MDITKLYQTQISLTEWLAGINHEKTEALRIEDNNKRDRLKVLNRIAGVPFDEPRQFPASAINENTEEFQKFLKEHGHELCALRLIPLDPVLPKLRMRGHTIREALSWFNEQKIDPEKYKADFVPHSEHSLWATIFVVNQQGVFGEIIRGGHHQLTQGIYEEERPITFSYDWKTWQLTPENAEAQKELEKIITYLHIPIASDRSDLKEKVSATFFNNYLLGYFETVTSEEFGLWFIDYNRLLGEMYQDFSVASQPSQSTPDLLKGQIGHQGKVTGTVRIVKREDIAATTLENDEILVCEMTTPEYIVLIQMSLGVITDLGGILSHAAIVCRELNKPCIVGTIQATQVLENGQRIELDGDGGTVKILS